MGKENRIDQIRVLIIEDELVNTESLKLVLDNYFPVIKILWIATNVKDSVKLIDKVQPDLIFLDIQIIGGDGFEVIRNTKFKNFKTIITTGFNIHAQESYEASVLYYLMKPITKYKLECALQRYYNTLESETNSIKKLESHSESIDKITISTNEGIQIFNKSEIIRFEAEGNYTRIYQTDGNSTMVSKNLQCFSDKLNHDFVRVHNSHIINIKYMMKYTKGKKCKVFMTDNIEVPISDKFRQDLFIKLDGVSEKI